MESLIRKQLASNEHLCALLASVMTSQGVEPCIFYHKSIADTDSPETVYPHVILSTDKFFDATHGVAGILTIDIITLQDGERTPEPIEKLIRESLEGVFFKPIDGEIFLLKWQKTDVFQELESEHTPGIIGATMAFEIYEFPCVQTSTPDPIEAINFWAQNWDENLTVIGASEFGEVFIPTHEKPAVYFDVTEHQLVEQQNHIVWIDATIAAHLFAPTVKSRREWLTILNQTLMFQGAIWLSDNSPLRLMDSKLNFTASEITGQLQLTMRYGLLRQQKYAHTLMGTKFSTDSNLRWQGVYDHPPK